jgi:hypothetical protein
MSEAQKRGYPPRQPRNGHHPDCPYPREPADTCAICAAIRKGDPNR